MLTMPQHWLKTIRICNEMRLIILRLTMGNLPGTRTELEAIIQYKRLDNEAEKKFCWMRGFIFQRKNTADDAVSTIVINVS